MSSIRIISNPYKKDVLFEKWSETLQEWTTIDYGNNPNSKLVRDELRHGFFPFRASQIIDAIIEEYEEDGHLISIHFRGTADEYAELEAVCEREDVKGKVALERESEYLENARDILPEVKQLFRDIEPLVRRSAAFEKINRDMARFSDASSDEVPICVLGNYSAGKSTFINSLIGSEILPSGIDPVTAKIYRIKRSSYPDRASVRCSCKNEDIKIRFTTNESKIENPLTDNPLVQKLSKGLMDVEKLNIAGRVSKAVEIINDYEDETEEILISDLIEIEIPFSRGILANSQHPFVVFDTPGSNSASNLKHLQVLKQAMGNMTNGLPIFLCTPDSLDSTDNETLYHIIRDFEELDDRFTMIVVNKADGPGLQRKDMSESEQSRVLGQAVPRNLYSGGLYYVSSILGLGSKNGGDFVDDYYAETYDDQVTKYTDPTHRRYKTLYSYNIMPPQIKKRSDAMAVAKSTTDPVYANSGLYSIEVEIENFAGKYSAYNKCFQSQMFLNNIIQITDGEIVRAKTEKEEWREKIIDELDKDKKRLCDELEGIAFDEEKGAISEYGVHVSVDLDDNQFNLQEDYIKEEEDKLTEAFENKFGYEDKINDTKKAFAAVGENFKAKFQDSGEYGKGLFSIIKKAAGGLKSDVSNVMGNYKAQRDSRKEVDVAVANELLNSVALQYEKGLEEVYIHFNELSQKYWTDNTEKIRDDLVKTVTGSEVLTEEQRTILEDIIITYNKIEFPEKQADELFKRENFQKKFQLGNLVFWSSDHLDIGKLVNEYNVSFSEGREKRYEIIKESHQNSAHQWVEDLLETIFKNMVDFSPELSTHAKHIQSLTDEITDFEQRQIKLQEYTQILQSMMEWKHQN